MTFLDVLHEGIPEEKVISEEQYWLSLRELHSPLLKGNLRKIAEKTISPLPPSAELLHLDNSSEIINISTSPVTEANLAVITLSSRRCRLQRLRFTSSKMPSIKEVRQRQKNISPLAYFSESASFAAPKDLRLFAPVRSKRCTSPQHISESATNNRLQFSSDEIFEFHSRSASPQTSPAYAKQGQNISPAVIDNVVTQPFTDIATNSITGQSNSEHSNVLIKVLPQAQGELSHKDHQEDRPFSSQTTLSLVDLYKRRCQSCSLCNEPNCEQCYSCITNENATLKEYLVCLRKVRGE